MEKESIEETVFIIKKWNIYEFKVKHENETHLIVSDIENNHSKPIYSKFSKDTVYKTKESAQKALSEDFQKGDLVICIKDCFSLEEGLVIDMNKNFVSVLIKNTIRRFSKSNVLKLNRQN